MAEKLGVLPHIIQAILNHMTNPLCGLTRERSARLVKKAHLNVHIHFHMSHLMSLLGVKRTSLGHRRMSANDPKADLGRTTNCAE